MDCGLEGLPDAFYLLIQCSPDGNAQTSIGWLKDQHLRLVN